MKKTGDGRRKMGDGRRKMGDGRWKTEEGREKIVKFSIADFQFGNSLKIANRKSKIGN